MSQNSSIEWTDDTWNPVRGCTKISPGCKHCYAETFAERFRGVPGHPYEQGFEPRLAPGKLDAPLHWKKPRRVFVNSMSDLFLEEFPNEYIAAVFGVMAAASQHTFQVLTKRSARMRSWFEWVAAEWRKAASSPAYDARSTAADICTAAALGAGAQSPALLGASLDAQWPLPNVWLGVSVEDQERADERIPDLLRTPAAVRFISAEPLLGPITLGLNLGVRLADGSTWTGSLPRLDWVIVGGESGRRARGFDLDWARSIVASCRSADVAVFVKQLGARPETRWSNGTVCEFVRLGSSKGADPAEESDE